MRVPPWPSLAITKLAAIYWPSNAILATWVPSLAVSTPPVSLSLVRSRVSYGRQN